MSLDNICMLMLKNARGLVISLIFMSLTLFATAQVKFTAGNILMKSIKTHDAEGNWNKLKASFDMSIVRENQADRFFIIDVNLPKKQFYYSVNTDSVSFKQGFEKDKLKLFYNQNPDISEADIKKYDLTLARTQYLREVYEYLLLLPMRLQNDTKFLSEAYSDEVFNGVACYKITIQYEPKAENETWHFFIDKKTFFMKGYQFYLKDKNTDGEYIYLSNYENFKGILLPKTKTWYWNKDKTFFRIDTILNVR
jgi:Family of unknown function (DUF6503)